MRDYIIDALRKGWKVIPLKKNSKVPNLPKGHKFLTEPHSKQELWGWAKESKFGNYAVVTGQMSGITVVDVDFPEGAKTLSELGIDVESVATPQVLTPNGRHLYFQYSPRVGTGVGVMGKGIDVRNNGAYVVGPGSVVDGEMYVWSDVYGPDTDMQAVPEWLNNIRREENGNEWKMTKKLGPGERNNKLASLAGALVIRDLPAPLVLETLLNINQKWCEQPLDKGEVENIVKSVERYRDEKKLQQDQ
jgi:putative DNA primase/helicase